MPGRKAPDGQGFFGQLIDLCHHSGGEVCHACWLMGLDACPRFVTLPDRLNRQARGSRPIHGEGKAFAALEAEAHDGVRDGGAHPN